MQGSRPSAMTLSDSRAMKLPAPAISDTSGSLISKKRLIGVLGQLGFLEDSADGQHLLSMIHALWQEAHEYASVGSDGVTQRNAEESKYHAVAGHDSDGTTSSQNDKEEQFSGSKDLVELGTLKWILYGFPAKQPTWFSKFCMPCRGRSGGQSLEKLQSKTALEEHPVHASRMQRRHGELVRHDVLTCKICQSAAGFQGYTEDEGDDEPSATKEVVSSHSGSSSGTSNADSYSAMMVASADDHSVVEDSSIEESVEITSLPAFREA